MFILRSSVIGFGYFNFVKLILLSNKTFDWADYCLISVEKGIKKISPGSEAWADKKLSAHVD